MIEKAELVTYLLTVHPDRLFYDDGWAESCMAANYAEDVLGMERGYPSDVLPDTLYFIFEAEDELGEYVVSDHTPGIRASELRDRLGYMLTG